MAGLFESNPRPLTTACALAFLATIGGVLPAADTAHAQRPAGAPAGAAAGGGREGGGAGASRQAGTSEPMNLFTVKNAAQKLANCNDGSPAVFYFQPGSSGDEKKWIIFFQGGGGCATDNDCAARWMTDKNLMTSVGIAKQDRADGILSTDTKVNPDFAHWTKVRLHYCSSDGYAGDISRKVGDQTFQFRGHRIVDAVFDDLMDASVVGANTLKNASEVLIVGTSAGAFGMENNIDRLAARLAPIKVKAVADSDWVPLTDNFGPGIFEVPFFRPAAMPYFNATVDESCAKANPTHAGDCLNASFLYPYISTPLFVYQDQHDPTLLSTLGIIGRPNTPQERAYVDKYAAAVRDTLTKQVGAAFSASLAMHTALMSEPWQGVKIQGQTLQETVGDWYFGRKGQVKLILQP